jgi:hypothetical protein
MNIVGAPNWNTDTLWYAQAVKNVKGETVPNSGIENILRKDDLQDQKTTRPGWWLEGCKNHSHYNAGLATRRDPAAFEKAMKLRLRGVRPPDYLCLWLNTPQNRAALGLTGADETMTNELNEVYPAAMQIVFDITCETWRIHTLDEALAWFSRGYAIVGSLSVSHSVMFKGYDVDTHELIYVDPDPPRVPAGVDWHNVRMGKVEFERDRALKPVVNIFPPE